MKINQKEIESLAARLSEIDRRMHQEGRYAWVYGFVLSAQEVVDVRKVHDLNLAIRDLEAMEVRVSYVQKK